MEELDSNLIQVDGRLRLPILPVHCEPTETHRSRHATRQQQRRVGCHEEINAQPSPAQACAAQLWIHAKVGVERRMWGMPATSPRQVSKDQLKGMIKMALGIPSAEQSPGPLDPIRDCCKLLSPAGADLAFPKISLGRTLEQEGP